MAEPFNSVVVSRTRVAELILTSPDLLSRFLASGGLKSDLQSIRNHGLHAEALNTAQSLAAGASAGASMATLVTFTDLQREYKAIMAVLLAVKGDLLEAGADRGLVAAVDRVLDDETQVFIDLANDGTDKAKKKATQEAVRVEIEKDANALLTLNALHPLLARRGVDKLRLKDVLRSAERLKGQLVAGKAKKDAKHAATGEEHAAVSAQSLRWSTVSRLIRGLAPHSESLRDLLKSARSSSKKGK